MEQNKQNQNQFSDFSNGVENDLQKGSLLFMNQIKNCNTLDKKISSINSLNLKDEIEYQQIINGILYGMFYDENMSLENYFQFLFSVNHDRFKTFVIKLADIISFARLKKEKYDKIYQIFEKLINIYLEKNDLIELMILICRKFYPGQEMLNSIIYDDNNSNIDDFVHNNTFYKFLTFLKKNLEFILENDKIINLPGIIFIKILRLLSESHIYQLKYDFNSDENINEKTSSIITNIVSTYHKINFSEKIKKLISEIYDIQIFILTKIYKEKKQGILSIGRELVRHLISISKLNIEIIKTIKNDLISNYETILSVTNSTNGNNIFTIINIPPLMERMLTYILTSIKRSSVTYSYYINWLFHEYKIENSMGNTLLVDITRFIMTNYYYYTKYQFVEDYVPRWLILCYLLKHIKNHIISSEIKQTIFLDLILFDKNKDSYSLIEPSLSCIIVNLKDYPAISEELIEFLEHYVKHFDNKNVQKRINSICDAFHFYEQKDRNNNNIDVIIKNSGMEEKFKNSFMNLIKNEIWLKENEINNTNNNVNINDNININNNIIDKKEEEKNSQIKQNFDNNLNNDNNNKNDNKIKESSKNNNINSPPPKLEKNKEVAKKVNIDILIPKEMTTYVSINIIRNFISEKNPKKFAVFLNELYKYNIKIFGNTNTGIKQLDPSYKNMCINFAKFYIKVFKDELEIKTFENFEAFNFNSSNYLYSYLFDYAYDKIEDNSIFQFTADLINKTIEIYPLLILHLISYILSNNFQPQKYKHNVDFIKFFFLLNNIEQDLIKQKLNLFFVQCEENFLNPPLKFFFMNGGVEIFNKIILDDEHLILKIIKNCDLVCINTINMSLINNKYILIDKKFFILFKYSILFSPLEKNIFWNLIFSQGKIPSITLEQFLINSINIIENPPSNKEETALINYNEFIGNIIKSIKILFKNEIINDINKGNSGLDTLSGKISHIFEFDSGLKLHIFILIDNFLEYYFDNKFRKKMFSLIVQKYYANNSKNIANLRNMLAFVYFFIEECKRRYLDDKKNNTWISEDTITIIKEITKIINNFNISEMQK